MEIIKETITNIVTKYKAADGTVFTTETECKIYEESAECALLARYKNLIIKSDYEWDLFGIGSEDCMIDVVKVNTEDDIKCIMQLLFLYNSKYFNDSKNVDKYYSKIQQTLNDDNYLYISRGIEGDVFWVIYSYKELQEKLNNSIIVKNETN